MNSLVVIGLIFVALIAGNKAYKLIFVDRPTLLAHKAHLEALSGKYINSKRGHRETVLVLRRKMIGAGVLLVLFGSSLFVILLMGFGVLPLPWAV